MVMQGYGYYFLVVIIIKTSTYIPSKLNIIVIVIVDFNIHFFD